MASTSPASSKTERRVAGLIPNSSIQFIDYRFCIDRLPSRDCAFWEERVAQQASGDDIPVLLRSLVVDERTRDLIDPETGQQPPDDEVYRLNRAKGMEPFAGKWVPLPVFRVVSRGSDGAEVYDKGPSNWARARVIELAERDRAGNSHGLTIAFDTALRSRDPERAYLAPSPSDSEEEQEFLLVHGAENNSWFLNEPWVSEWLEELFREFKQAQKPGRRLREEDFPYACEHWARYLTFLQLLADAGATPRIKLIDVVSKNRHYTPIDVDLVLDVGNSRTCGMLIEYNRDERLNLNDSYVLKLRDLSRAEMEYSRPFESRIEFARASFGKDAISRRSGRGNAFHWPSPVRIGPEAMRLAGASLGNEGATGLSSPKRYLWDERPLNQGWRFNGIGTDGVTTEPPVTGPFMAFVTESGDVLRQMRGNGQPAVRARFTRSAMYGLLLTEVLMQTLVQINAIETRANRRFADVPRRLRRVILTMPPAMPLAEQRVLRKRAEGAIKLTWDIMGWQDGGPHVPPEPRVVLNLDEASCTQFVFLYTEVTQRFQGDAEALFAIWGKPRPGFGDAPSLRIASIDIGGGTTDLMITTFAIEGKRAINPTQNFREGFRIAGDDVLAAVIERAILPFITDALHAHGVAEPGGLLRRLVGGDRGGQSELERHLRRQFVTQVLEPIGLAMLHAYEKEPNAAGELWRRTIEQFFSSGARPSERIAEFIENAAIDHGAVGFKLMDIEVAAEWSVIDNIVRSVLSQTMADLCEVINAYDCDFLVVSGRPSRLPAVQDIVLSKLPVMPDRIVPMHQYHVGEWYPFRDLNGRVDDPKTTAAVGAMLYTLAEGYLEAFLMRASQLRMRSTARFIGEMELSGQIKHENVYLSELDLDAKKPQGGQQFKMQFFAPMFLGFRQLPVERWQASPIYFLEFGNADSASRLALPLTLTLERAEQEEGREEAREDFRVSEIEDCHGSVLRRTDVVMRLQTLKSDAGYWLDTGILSVR